MCVGNDVDKQNKDNFQHFMEEIRLYLHGQNLSKN